MHKESATDISFGEWVRQRRHIVDLTQQELADRVGCARITLRRIEAGTLKPSKELAQILLEKLGAPPAKREAWLGFARGLSGFPGSGLDLPASEPMTNLPTWLTSFIGREKEQEQVTQLIAKHRLVTIAGTGGIGKTRLAQQVGQRLLNDYPNGVWFIALDSLSNPLLVPQTVASVFGIREDSSDSTLIERLTFSLRAKTVLLILDNCEHLLEACAQLIKTLLSSCPKLKFLATSREALGVEGEVTYVTPSLTLPDGQNIKPIEELTQYESVRLFCDRAALAMPSFTLNKDKAAAIINSSRLLDGIPLAIELAAAHVDILQVHEILEQLQHCLDLLISNSRTVPLKHQTIRASLDWSWGLLSEAEQTFLRQLSVFAGGWNLESAEAVCEDSTLNLMGTLAKKSLIIVNQESGHDTRYHFHEIVRQYAHEKLIEAGEEQHIRTQHLKFFLQFSEQAETALRGPTQMDWYARLFDERDNIRATLEWANETDVEAGLYVSGRLYRFWESFDLSEGARWLTRFIQKSESNHYPLARAKALCTQSRIMSVQDYNFAYIEAPESLDIYKANGDKSGEIDALLALGVTLIDFNAPIEKVMNLFESALTLSETLGDQWRQACALSHIGWHNNHQRSISILEKAVKLFEKVGDIESSTNQMLNLGIHHMLNGNLQLAQEWLDEVVKASQNLNNKGLQADILQQYGWMALIRGDYKVARTNLLEAMEMSRAMGYLIAFLWSHVRLGYVALREGNVLQARSIFTETTGNFQEDQNTIGVVFTLEGMAILYITLGKADMAAHLVGWADSTREKIYNTRPPIEQVDVDKIIGACLEKMGEAAFSDAYEEGQKMTLDEAVAYALKEN